MKPVPRLLRVRQNTPRLPGKSSLKGEPRRLANPLRMVLFVAAAASALLPGATAPTYAQGVPAPIRIGVLNDQTAPMRSSAARHRFGQLAWQSRMPGARCSAGRLRSSLPTIRTSRT